MSTPLVTVGIPTFNRPEGLAKTLRIVTSQTYRHLEIIVSDNHSSDEIAVRQVLESFASDTRVRFIRQPVNLGSVKNFEFLLRQATGQYFLWVADDDEVDVGYVEALLRPHLEEQGVAISMTHYTQTDSMEVPHIARDLSEYLTAIQADLPEERLERYLRQPDHFGKSRLVWGMFSTEALKQVFSECLEDRLDATAAPIWGDLPVEFAMLARGRLVMVPQLLFHVYLLPSSDGRQGLGVGMRLVSILKKSSHAYLQVIRRSGIPVENKTKLRQIVRVNQSRSIPQLLVYYGLQSRFPLVARWIKVVFYALTAKKPRNSL